MAARAVLGKDRCDVLRVRDRGLAMVAIGRCDVFDGGAARPGLRLLDLTAGEHVVDRGHEVLVGRAAIQHLGRAGLHQEHFADLVDAEPFGDQLRFVHQHRDVEAVLVELLLHRLARFVRDRVDHEELDLALVLRARLVEGGEVLVADRAGAALDQQRDRLVVVVVTHLVEVALLVQQGEISDALRIGGRTRGASHSLATPSSASARIALFTRISPVAFGRTVVYAAGQCCGCGWKVKIRPASRRSVTGERRNLRLSARRPAASPARAHPPGCRAMHSCPRGRRTRTHARELH